MKEKIQYISNATGMGLRLCAKAYKLCGDAEVAIRYLYLKGSAVSRKKRVNGQLIPWTDEDYIQEAKKTLDNSKNF